jgi:O-acetyl-ADP-ribose deacetylase
MERTVGQVKIDCVLGDITCQRGFDAIVNAANAHLTTGGGVAGAIHDEAGPRLYEECRALAPIKPGQAVITGGHDLPNPYVIHCLGPVYGRDEPSAALLAGCYRNSLALAEQRGLTSVAFPAISAGIFGYPVKEAAEVAVRTVVETAPSLKSVRAVRFVLFGDEALCAYEKALAALVS